MSILLLIGPTCSGKTTLENIIQSKGFGRVVSQTTRPIRANEVDGQDYYFVDNQFFKQEQENFLENVTYNNYRYGVHKTELDRNFKQGFKHIVIVVEPGGAAQIAKWGLQNEVEVLFCNIRTQSRILYKRFLNRFLQENDPKSVLDTYASRLEFMVEEDANFDYRLYDTLEPYLTVNNELRLQCLNETPEQLADIIIQWVDNENRKSCS